MQQRIRVAILAAVLALVSLASTAAAQQLEIHYINVGWGGSVLVKGPTGTTVLMEAGNTGKGTAYVVPYLQSIGLVPATGLDYTIAGHQHCDHIGGLDEVVNAGYNVHLKNYYNGSSYSSTCATEWSAKAATMGRLACDLLMYWESPGVLPGASQESAEGAPRAGAVPHTAPRHTREAREHNLCCVDMERCWEGPWPYWVSSPPWRWPRR